MSALGWNAVAWPLISAGGSCPAPIDLPSHVAHRMEWAGCSKRSLASTLRLRLLVPGHNPRVMNFTCPHQHSIDMWVATPLQV